MFLQLLRHSLVLLCLIFIGLMVDAQAQSRASVSGYVSEKKTGETLIQAIVSLKGTSFGAVTNTSGYYTLSGIPAGEYTILIRYVGYKTFEKNLVLSEGERLRLDVELDVESADLETVVVTSQKAKEELKNIGIATVKAETIKELPAIFEADVFRSIQLLPGVAAANDFSSGLYIRGGGPDQTLILLDRTTVYNPSHFFGFFSTFNPDAIKDIKLYKGGYAAEFGGRLGSVLDIYNKDGNRKEMAGGFTLGMLASKAYIEGPFEKGSYMLAARRSTLEPLLYALRDVSESIPEMFYFYDVNSKVNFDYDANNRFSLALYSGQDNVRVPFASDAQANLKYGNITSSLNWTHLFTDRVYSNFTFTGSRYYNFPLLSIGGTAIERENNIYDFSVKGDIEAMLDQHNEVKVGFWGGNMLLTINDRFDNRPSFRSRLESYYIASFVQHQWRPTEQWIINSGLRANYFANGDFFRVDPRLAVEYRIHPRVRLQAAAGRYTQFLSLISNEAFSGFDVWLITGPGVAPSYGDQLILGAKTILADGYNMDVEVYYRTMRDLFELDPFLPNTAGLNYNEVFRFGDGYAYGAEVLFEKTRGNLTGFLGYTYGIARRRFPNINLGNFYPPKYDRTHDINLVTNYRINRKWKFTSVFSFATGQAFTLPLGRSQMVNDPFGTTPRDFFTVGRLNASRLPDYHRWDIGFTRSSTFFGKGEAEWQFQLINVYNRANVWFYTYDFQVNPVQRGEITLLPILPTISYSVKF